MEWHGQNLTPKYEVGTSFVTEGGWSGTLQNLTPNNEVGMNIVAEGENINK